MRSNQRRLFAVVTLADGESWLNAHERAVAELDDQAHRRGASGAVDVAVAKIEGKTLMLTADLSPTEGDPQTGHWSAGTP